VHQEPCTLLEWKFAQIILWQILNIENIQENIQFWKACVIFKPVGFFIQNLRDYFHEVAISCKFRDIHMIFFEVQLTALVDIEN
jgi:hypothetical protein